MLKVDSNLLGAQEFAQLLGGPVVGTFLTGVEVLLLRTRLMKLPLSVLKAFAFGWPTNIIAAVLRSSATPRLLMNERANRLTPMLRLAIALPPGKANAEPILVGPPLGTVPGMLAVLSKEGFLIVTASVGTPIGLLGLPMEIASAKPAL